MQKARVLEEYARSAAFADWHISDRFYLSLPLGPCHIVVHFLRASELLELFVAWARQRDNFSSTSVVRHVKSRGYKYEKAKSVLLRDKDANRVHRMPHKRTMINPLHKE